MFDAFHMNSIALAPDGDLLISMRHTSTVYKVSPSTGQIAWQLGGKHSTFALQPGVQFAFQHDAQFADPHTIRLFNNDTDGADTLGQSSIEWIRLDEAAHTATLVRNQTHPGGVQTFAMGNAQPLPNGNTFGGWGTGQHISEFGPSGELVYDAQTPQAPPIARFCRSGVRNRPSRRRSASRPAIGRRSPPSGTGRPRSGSGGCWPVTPRPRYTRWPPRSGPGWRRRSRCPRRPGFRCRPWTGRGR
ncbi:hypothetical protein C1Y40_03648 [Mycobacterium talmoniae]|uniref:Arylsulfotransferase (ASST) n=1 Tax=Mycobacterium talmoniae TaxID=1858794 RepID=A0A2S8BHT3_9MYCO|nr:hypothetical protein C1Y40_03648 [Mycobacterium talmoniae]